MDSTTVVVTRDGGDVHPATVQVYYGRTSHLVNVKPIGDWDPDASYTVTVSPPITSWDGVPFGNAVSFTFSTKPAPPVEPVPEVAEVVEVAPEWVEVEEVAPERAEVAEVVEPAPEFVEVPDIMAPLPDAPTSDAFEAAGDAGADAGPVAGKSSGCTAATGGTPHLATTLLMLTCCAAFLAVRLGRGSRAFARGLRGSGS